LIDIQIKVNFILDDIIIEHAPTTSDPDELRPAARDEVPLRDTSFVDSTGLITRAGPSTERLGGARNGQFYTTTSEETSDKEKLNGDVSQARRVSFTLDGERLDIESYDRRNGRER